MARQPRTRGPKKKFAKDKRYECRICKGEIVLRNVQGVMKWACSVNINH